MQLNKSYFVHFYYLKSCVYIYYAEENIPAIYYIIIILLYDQDLKQLKLIEN